jgi:hypothetical protein
MKRKKKGQIIGQVFIYIMAVIVIGGIALVGYNAVKKIMTMSCSAEKASFKTDIIGLIEKWNTDSNMWPLKAPCEYDTVCFVDASDLNGGNSLNKCSNPVIKNSIKTGNMQNIFVISNSATTPIGYSDLISLDSADKASGCLCIKQRNNNFYITFYGHGSNTEIRSS